jgi:pimeloyl-ACP methyl ester carboxylesterase
MNRSRTDETTADAITEAEVTRTIQRGPTRWLEIGGGRIASWSFGRGPDVLFIHGWPIHAATFRRIVPHLAGSFTCHLVDLPGAGQSTPGPGAPIGLLEHATTVRACADALGLDDYAIVAHDSGGFVGRHVAADDGRVRGLVLGGTEIPGHMPWLVAMYAMIARTPGGPRVVQTVLRSRMLRTSFLGFAGCFEDARYAEGDFHDLFVAPLLGSQQRADDALELLRGITGDVMNQLADVHRHITVPVDLIWGVEDPFFPIGKARRMTAQFGGPTTFHEIPKAKLFAHEDRPLEFASITKRALASYFAEKRRGSARVLASA